MSIGIHISGLQYSGWQSNWRQQRELQALEQAFAGSNQASTPEIAADPPPGTVVTDPTTPPAPPAPSTPANPSGADAQPDSGSSLISALHEIEQGIQTLVLALQPGGSGPASAQGSPAAPGTSGGAANSLSHAVITDFNALGQALQSGDLDGAQKAFSTLQQDLQPGWQPSPPTNGDTIVQAFNHLGQALQSGDLSGAQQAFSTLQQDLQPAGAESAHRHHHHHHHHNSSSGAQDSPLAGAFESLSQALQKGNLAAAQKAYATLQQDLEPGTSISTTDAGPATSSTPLSTTA